MISYYGTTISPNQLETGEGFLICRNVPIARTGTQDYIGREIGIESDEVVKVNRPESEVFSDAAMASFEGKPVTNNHPTELVTPDTATIYEKGHAQNVRRGSGEFVGYLIADLHIHDAELINAIKSGKRQISCGYECEYVEDENGINQTNIRGNHIAVVDEGRAGAKAAIMDSNTHITETVERKQKMSKRSTFLTLFGMAANGKSNEDVKQLALDTAEALDATEETKDAEAVEVQAEATDACKDACKDADPIAEMNAKLDKLIELLTAKAMDAEEPTTDAEEKAPIDAAIEELEATKEGAEELATEVEAAIEPDGEARVVEAEEMDACKDEALDSATQMHLLKGLRDSIAGITDEAQRKAVTDALLNTVKSKKSEIANVINAQNSYVNTKTFGNEDIQAAYDAMNPHKRAKEA